MKGKVFSICPSNIEVTEIDETSIRKGKLHALQTKLETPNNLCFFPTCQVRSRVLSVQPQHNLALVSTCFFYKHNPIWMFPRSTLSIMLLNRYHVPYSTILPHAIRKKASARQGCPRRFQDFFASRLRQAIGHFYNPCCGNDLPPQSPAHGAMQGSVRFGR